MGLFELGRRVVDKRLDDAAAKAVAKDLTRVDTGLPFNAQIGGLIEVPRASFALLDGTLVKVPATAQMPIVAAGRVRVDGADDLVLHRLYTSCGYNRNGEGQSFLQVLRQGEEILDIGYFSFLCRQVPMTEAEQEPFLGKGFGLGDIDYFMREDQLTASGFSDEQIDALLPGDTDALNFVRDAPTGDAYIEPYTARETRLDDSVGEKGLQKQLHFMPYTRALSDGQQERLLVSFEVVESMDGKRAPQVYVDFLVGISLDRQKIKVL